MRSGEAFRTALARRWTGYRVARRRHNASRGATVARPKTWRLAHRGRVGARRLLAPDRNRTRTPALSGEALVQGGADMFRLALLAGLISRSEEHTSELQ